MGIIDKLPKEISDLIISGLYSLYRSKKGGRYLISAKGEAYFLVDATGAHITLLLQKPDFTEWEQEIPDLNIDFSALAAAHG